MARFLDRTAFEHRNGNRLHPLYRMTQAHIFERANMPLGHTAPISQVPRVDTVPARSVVEEPTPESRSATFKQHFEGIPFKKRALLLAAAIAVPAMAAPGDFGALPGDATRTGDDFATRAIVNAALPFERPGQSFPGSAFYYLGDPPEDALIALPTTDAFDTGAEGERQLGAAIDAGPPARPFFSSVAGQGHMRALDCMAQAIWYEAASESTAGQRAVAQVVLNRVAHPSWPGSVCGVVYEGSQRSTGCQFSFTCDGSLARRARGGSWEKARRLASEALSGSVYAPIGHATHYHTLWVNPYWAGSLDHVGTIGAHRFYRNRGRAGEKSAFTGSYAGVEPSVSGRMKRAPSVYTNSSATGEVTSTSAPPPGSAIAPPQAAPAPRYADPSLEGSGNVKPGFSNAGQWKKIPGKSSTAEDQ
ncbi:cell wall hydrolase [Erythrobacter sp. YT30]|uniref:cell wall hydrolase n=1 Tax=Erythrobacter sp. YT30 TaxID=1735012 RepID=UPI001F25DBEC|nr:cell wall hydrolase [Erythrobacter sp. YT30]